MNLPIQSRMDTSQQHLHNNSKAERHLDSKARNVNRKVLGKIKKNLGNNFKVHII